MADFNIPADQKSGSAGGGAASGAASGAAAGASFGPWGAVGGAVIGGISGYLSGKSKKRAIEERNQQLRKARALATPAHLKELMVSMSPMFREIVAAGLGPQFMQEVSVGLSRHGLTGTGAGEAMRTASTQAPAVAAAGMAADRAERVQRNEVNTALQSADIQPVPNPLLETLQGGVQGAFSMARAFGEKRPSTSGVNDGRTGLINPGTPGIASDSPVNLTPVTQFGPGYQPNVWGS